MSTFDTDHWWDPDGFLFGLHELLGPVRIPYIVQAVAAAPPGAILDIGCGGGFVAASLVGMGHDVVGVDVSASAIRAAASGAPGGVYSVADGALLPFRDGSFSVVIMSEVLEHVPNPDRVVAEATRVTRNGGVLVVTGPNRTRLSRLAFIRLAQDWPTAVLPTDLHDHASFVRPGELDTWLMTAGCVVTDVRGVAVALRDVPAAMVAYAGLRLGRLATAEACRRIRLRESRSKAVAYMLTAVRTV